MLWSKRIDKEKAEKSISDVEILHKMPPRNYEGLPYFMNCYVDSIVCMEDSPPSDPQHPFLVFLISSSPFSFVFCLSSCLLHLSSLSIVIPSFDLFLSLSCSNRSYDDSCK